MMRERLKAMLAELPLTVEVYSRLRERLSGAEGGARPKSGVLFNLPRLEDHLTEWVADVSAASETARTKFELLPEGKRRKVALFGFLSYWIEHESLMGLSLAGLGCDVHLLYWSYCKYNRAASRFDLRRQDFYVQRVMAPAQELLHPVSLLAQPQAALPPELEAALRDTTLRDTQYILQVEEVSTDSEMYQLRWRRNTEAAARALSWFEAQRPDVVIIPNGAILEFEAVYLAARQAGVRTVTYEFSDLSQHIWLAQGADVMRQDTDALWAERRDQPLTEAQTQALRDFFAARQRPLPQASFVFRYQGAGLTGGSELRRQLGLDARPVILLPANVVGDSVTLGRQIFSSSMSEWLERSLHYFVEHPQLQLVVRIHPGEALTKGPSVAELVQRALPDGLPENIHLVPADAKVNTYDLVETADAGLVYTTTVGLEMAMSGVPVIVVGRAHYRGRGFTLDPNSWEEYFQMLDGLAPSLSEGEKSAPALFAEEMKQGGVEMVWNYAYRYFFEFPHAFPWHLYRFDEDIAEWPLRRVLSAEGLARFGRTLRFLAGEPLTWKE